jgi:HD-GYP domain-containing protein (c-di-GMP phosphodiesterase class II)
VIRAHHERWDGQGYPNHLKGEAIPLGARILTVVDAYLAMTVDRPYQKACAPSVALAELGRCAGSQFDPHVVAAATFLLRHPDQRRELLLRR